MTPARPGSSTKPRATITTRIPRCTRFASAVRRASVIVIVTTIGLAGCGGGRMKALLDCPIVVPSHNMQQVEDAHLVLAHMIFLDLKARIEARGAAGG